MSRSNTLLPALAVLLAALFRAAIAAEPVELFSPQGEVKQVRQVTARFAEQMVAFGDPREVAPFDIDCPAAGSGHWVDGRNWTYEFAADLPAGVACRFTLKAGLSTLAGTALPGGPSYTFNTGGPAILRGLPYEGDERIDENQTFILGLDAPAKTALIERHAYCAVAGVGERIPLRVITGEERRRILEARPPFLEQFARALFKSGGRTWLAILRLPESGSDEDRFLRLRDTQDSPLVVAQCKRALPPEAEVKLVWGAGIESASGIASSQDQVLTFKTRPAFDAKFRCERVNRKAQCIPFLPMRVVFSAPVPFLEAATIRLKAQSGRVYKPNLTRNEAIDSLVETVSFEGPFPERSAFKLEIPADLKDDAGRTLVKARRFPLTVRTDENPPLAKFRPGDRAMVADTPWGKVGLTVCYDVRFAYLYRALAQAGASFLTVPAAFTVPTGRTHWHTLLRARAIETGCFVFAPAQCGEHAEGRKTYGHSLIVAPWGEVLADGGEEPGVITADIDPAKVEEARRMVPALQHDRRFELPAREPRRAAGE